MQRSLREISANAMQDDLIIEGLSSSMYLLDELHQFRMVVEDERTKEAIWGGARSGWKDWWLEGLSIDYDAVVNWDGDVAWSFKHVEREWLKTDVNTVAWSLDHKKCFPLKPDPEFTTWQPHVIEIPGLPPGAWMVEGSLPGAFSIPWDSLNAADMARQTHHSIACWESARLQRFGVCTCA